jgi:hypothetical protein
LEAFNQENPKPSAINKECTRGGKVGHPRRYVIFFESMVAWMSLSNRESTLSRLASSFGLAVSAYGSLNLTDVFVLRKVL